MSNTAIAKFFGGNVDIPRNRKALSDALEGLSAAVRVTAGGRSLLKLSKTGQWNFGVDNVRLEAGTFLVVNPASFASGFVAWHKGQIEGEYMNPIESGPVNYRSLPEVNSKQGWQAQLGVLMATLDDPPLNLEYKTNSVGGIKALSKLMGEIAFGLKADSRRVFPVISIGSDSYIHREWGEVFTPVFEIAYWLDENGNRVEDRKSLV
jgi:hypothetical protein